MLVTVTFSSNGINWIWYLCGDFDESLKTVKIHYHQRWHKYDNDSKHPKSDYNDFEIIEDSERIARQVKVKQGIFTVTNPQYVFSYNDFTYYVPEENKHETNQ